MLSSVLSAVPICWLAQRAETHRPFSPRQSTAEAIVLLKQAGAAEQARDFPEAYRLYREVLYLLPNHPVAAVRAAALRRPVEQQNVMQHAREAEGRDNLPEALRALRWYLEEHPTDADVQAEERRLAQALANQRAKRNWASGYVGPSPGSLPWLGW